MKKNSDIATLIVLLVTPGKSAINKHLDAIFVNELFRDWFIGNRLIQQETLVTNRPDSWQHYQPNRFGLN